MVVCLQIETLLDESTAEIGKLEVSPLLTTIEMSCKLKKAVPLHTTLRIDAKVSPNFSYLNCHIWHLIVRLSKFFAARSPVSKGSGAGRAGPSNCQTQEKCLPHVRHSLST